MISRPFGYVLISTFDRHEAVAIESESVKFFFGGGGWIQTEAPSLTKKDRDMTNANTNQYQLLVISEEDAIFYAMEWVGAFFGSLLYHSTMIQLSQMNMDTLW